MRSFFNVRFVYDYVFPFTKSIVTCIIVNNASCTIFKHVGLVMKMLVKILKWFLVIKYQLGKMWKNFVVHVL